MDKIPITLYFIQAAQRMQVMTEYVTIAIRISCKVLPSAHSVIMEARVT